MQQLADIAQHERWFADYSAQKCAQAQGDTRPLELKIRHSCHVLDNARHIVSEGHFTPELSRTCLLAALYHDVARFEQYLRYHTFKDSDSCNHGAMGVKILKLEKPLDREKKDVRRLVLAAVGLHNRFSLPSGLSEDLLFTAKIVRDADKLDILRIMDEHLNGPRPYCPTVILSLPDSSELYSKAVIEAALAERTASYADLRSVNDFRLLLGTWFFDMHFPASRKLFVETGHATRLVEDLPLNGPHSKARDLLLLHFQVLKGCLNASSQAEIQKFGSNTPRN